MRNGDSRVAHAQVGVAGRRHGGGMRALVNAHPRAEKEGSEMAERTPCSTSGRLTGSTNEEIR